MSMIRKLAVLLALALPGVASGQNAPAAAPAAQNALFRLAPAESMLSYHITWTLHDATGVSKQLQGAAALKPGEAQVQIRAPVVSFDSGNANRDSHMKETVEAAKYPFVTLKGVIKGFAPPTAYPATQKVNLDAQIEFHGITQPKTVPVELSFPDAGHVNARTEFDISLESFKIDRPSLMFKKIDDKTHIKADLRFAK